MLGDAVVEEPVPGPSQPPQPAPPPPPPTPPVPQPGGSDEPQLIDVMIARMQGAQDERAAASRGEPIPRASQRRRESSATDGPMSPRGSDGPLSPSARGPRRSGNVVGVRQSTGNVPVSHRANATDLVALSRRVVVKHLDPVIVK